MAKDKTNIVKLTYREHYICHWLLTKIYPSKEMTFAFWAMQIDKLRRNYITNSYAFEQSRKRMAECMKGNNNPMYGKKPSEFTLNKLKEANIGRKKTPEEIERQRLAMTGRKHSLETRQRISSSLKGRTFSDEHKKHIGDRKRGQHWKLSEETKEKQSLAQAGKRKGWKFLNNGLINRFVKECPGEGWVRGILYKRKQK